MFGSLIPRKGRSTFPTTDRFSRMLNRWEDEMEDLRKQLWGRDGASLLSTDYMPKVDFVETEKQFEVTVDLPGLKPEEVSVELKNGELWISGEHKEEKEEKGKTYHRVERHHGEFRRVLAVPNGIDEEAVEAKFEDGVLRVAVPKNEEARPKHIHVKA